MPLPSTSLQILEHSVLAVLTGYVLFQWLWPRRRTPDYLSLINSIKAKQGPESVLFWKGVSQAPTPTMDMQSVPVGEAAAHQDARGAIYRFKLGPDMLVNMYYTKQGYRRSGDLHNCIQYDVVLQGRTRLRMIDPHTGQEVVHHYEANDFIVIPAR